MLMLKGKSCRNELRKRISGFVWCDKVHVFMYSSIHVFAGAEMHDGISERRNLASK